MELKLFCVLILGIFACSKVNQWKQPTQVCFNVELVGSDNSSKLTLNEGYLLIESFNFDGKREEGGDVYFVKNFDSDFNANFGAAALGALSFDIPQGDYHDIDINIVSEHDDLPNLVLSGTYQDPKGNAIPVRFELNQAETFEITGQGVSQNQNEVELVEGLKTNAAIQLNAYQWFENISLERAEVVSLNGEKVILINDQTNVMTYQKVVACLNKTANNAVFTKE
jgi:hypothetical protein